MLTKELEIFAAYPYFDFEKEYLALVPLGYTSGIAYVVDGDWGI